MAHEDEELELDEVARRFETVKAHEIREPDSISLTSSRSKSPELDEFKIIDPAKYTDTLDFQYVDFAKRTKPEESPTFRETVSIDRLITNFNSVIECFFLIVKVRMNGIPK